MFYVLKTFGKIINFSVFIVIFVSHTKYQKKTIWQFCSKLRVMTLNKYILKIYKYLNV